MFSFFSPGPVFCLTRNSMVIAVGHRGRTLKCTVGELNEYDEYVCPRMSCILTNETDDKSGI